jgi:nucleoside-diphosphate-sugar epimerase
MKKVLILGGKGFLGSRVTATLAESNLIDLICHDRSMFSLSETSKLLDALEGGVDAIVNCAATVSFDSQKSSDYFYPVNVLVPSLLADWCKNNDKFYVHVSSSAVHGVKSSYVSVNSPYNPDTPYGYSKYLADLNVICSGAKNAIVRFGGIWGKNGPEHLGLNKAVASALFGKQLTIFGRGGLRNYVHVNCAAKAIAHILNYQLTGIFFCGSPNSITIEEMIVLLSEKFKLPAMLRKHGYMMNDSVIEASHEIKDLVLDFHEALEVYF